MSLSSRLIFNPLTFRLGSTLFSLHKLDKALGLGAMPGLFYELMRRSAAGEPFVSLPPPATIGEKKTRQQAKPAILLFQALTRRVGRERALAIMEEIIKVSSVLFLYTAVPPLDHTRYLQMTHTKRHKFLQDIVAKFPNALIDDLRVEQELFSFKVVSCEFQRLVELVGEPDLGHLFCEGDLVFFDKCVKDVILERPKVLSGGDPYCEFIFRWR